MKFLSALAFVSGVAAQSASMAAPASSAGACSAVATQFASLIQGIPQPSGSLSSFLATAYSSVTNPCAVSIPTGISSAYLNYGNSVLSFYSVNQGQIASALAICPSITSVAAFPICASLFVPASAPATATPTATTTKSPTASSTMPAVVVSTGGARDTRESGLMAASFAVAGMVGAVAVML